MNKTLIICGPTATGKTTLAVQLAKKFNGELVSADSRQIYKEMDIGTGKDLPKKFSEHTQPRKAGFSFPELKKSQFREWSVRPENFKNKKYELIPYDMDGIPLWLYDVVNPDEEFSVAHYQHLATVVIKDIRKRGKLPIVVGGTGLYIKSLLSPIETSHIPPNKKLRKTLERFSLEDLQKRLRKEDSLTWDLMNLSDSQNPRRLIRKIEIIEFYRHPGLDPGSRPIQRRQDSCFRRNDINEDTLLIGLTASYPVLYERIDDRVEKRVQQGIVGEVKSLLGKGYSWDLPSMNTFGYKEWKEYFNKGFTQSRKAGFSFPELKKSQFREWSVNPFQDVIQRWKWDEHGYARRQMAWFKNMKGIRLVDITSRSWNEKVEAIVGSWYT